MYLRALCGPGLPTTFKNKFKKPNKIMRTNTTFVYKYNFVFKYKYLLQAVQLDQSRHPIPEWGQILSGEDLYTVTD